MTFENWSTSAKINVGSESCRDYEEFCYLGSTISRLDCEREVLIRLEKANTVLGRLVGIWATKKMSLLVKVRLYESLVLSVLYMEQKHMTDETNITKKLKATHHRLLRKILHVSWKNINL